jgi:xylan 1,4-beta-xylosidase
MHPHNPLITSYGHPELRLQKAGHGSMCDSPDGRTYLAYLCGRPLPGTGNCVLGRETAIAELEWHDDWPYVKPEPGKKLFVDGIAWNHPTNTFSPPNSSYSGDPILTPNPQIYRFDGEEIHRDFKTLRTERDPQVYSLKERPGYLRLRGGQSPVSPFSQTLLARRQTDFSFKAETCLEFVPHNFQELAGLCWRYDEPNQYLLALTHNEETGRVLLVLSMIGGVFSRSLHIAVPDTGPIWLGLAVQERYGRFRYSLEGETWTEVGPVLDAVVLSDEYYRLGFTGAFMGIFCVDTASYAAQADFSYFSYTPLGS